ncbi:hypothetical protein [Paracoccus sp. J39]|uniref:hypothetical protein n=1 Tax=Paracoccus sp. J39 TaxID=935848 RepID=UPI00048C96B3|nr:hypothetical protein [Paracoccus sp. J39]
MIDWIGLPGDAVNLGLRGRGGRRHQHQVAVGVLQDAQLHIAGAGAVRIGYGAAIDDPGIGVMAHAVMDAVFARGHAEAVVEGNRAVVIAVVQRYGVDLARQWPVGAAEGRAHQFRGALGAQKAFIGIQIPMRSKIDDTDRRRRRHGRP